MECRTNDNNGYHPLFIVILILLFHLMIFIKNQDSILHQITLRDFDGYWHLVRVKDLHDFGNLYETTLTRSNAPYGESIHWTSAFDLLLYAGAYFGSFFVDFNVALLWWAIIINPVLHVLTFLVLFWALRDFFGNLRASIFGILFPVQSYISSIFDIGIPDHHGAQLFIFSLFIALSIKSIISDNWKIFLFCGIVGGLSIWLGIESLSVVLITISFFCFIWVLEVNSYPKNILIFSFMLLLTTSLTLILDTDTNDFMTIAYDRRSVVHVFLWFIITSFWIFVSIVNKWTSVLDKKIIRVITTTFGGIFCILVMHELFPLFFTNPLSDVNPLLKSIYLNRTDEFTGLFPISNMQSTVAYVYWAMTLSALPIGIYNAFHNSHKERQIWIFIILINLFYIILSTIIFRMITYAILCALIPISYAISHLFILISNKLTNSYYRIVRTTFIFTCCITFLAPRILFKSNRPEYLVKDKIFLSQFCNYLNDDPYFEIKPRRILTSINIGPLLLYKTKHEVIGTPSHRNVSGILDTYYVMNAREANDAHMIIRRRGIDVIILGRPENGIGGYLIDIKNGDKKSGDIFYFQLWKGHMPAWLQAYPVPKSLDGKIKIFMVIG